MLMKKRLVYYDLDNPSRCIVDGDHSYNVIPWFAFVLPIIFIIISVFNFIKINRRTKILFGDPRHDGRTYDADGLVDLIIDESNPNHYFIDFEINRLTGNTKSDYFQIPETETKTNIYDHNDINISK